jgi:hypothetical protein
MTSHPICLLVCLMAGCRVTFVMTPAKTALFLSLAFLFFSVPEVVLVQAIFGTSNATNSPATVSLTGTGAATRVAGVPTCGLPDDGLVHIPPNYTTFTPPAKGGSYTDPAFGCVVHRLTDMVNDNPEGNGTSDPPTHYYNTVSPLNSNDTYVLLRGSDSGNFYVVDMSGNKIIDQAHMPCYRSSQPLWAYSDPNSFYYAGCDNVLREFTITGTNTGNITVVHTFSEYSNVTNPDASDISEDGDHLLLAGMHTGTNGTQVPIDVFTYSLSLGTKSFLYTTVSCKGTVGTTLGAQPDSDCIHKMEITPTNQGIVQWNGSTCPECNGDQTIINANGTITKVLSAIHFQPGWDITGTHPLVVVERDDYHGDPCWNGGGYTALYLDTMTDHCLDSVDYQGSHVSYGGGPNQPWVEYDDEPAQNTCYFNTSPNFQSPALCSLGGGGSSNCWYPYSGEIDLVRIDSVGNTGSQGGTDPTKFYRLVHQRSRQGGETGNGYFSQARATISRDGKYIVWDSNMAYINGCPAQTPSGEAPQGDCTDVYWINIQ